MQSEVFSTATLEECVNGLITEARPHDPYVDIAFMSHHILTQHSHGSSDSEQALREILAMKLLDSIRTIRDDARNSVTQRTYAAALYDYFTDQSPLIEAALKMEAN